MNKNEKTILITGCSSGIGYDSAHHLHRSGYRVFATARSLDDVKRLKDEGLNAYHMDMRDSNSITSTLNEVLCECDNQLYAVFNNAGYGQPGALEDISRDALREQFETNVLGLHELTRQVIPYMRLQGYGKIIQHSSVLGLISLQFRGAYNASKYAIEGLCDTLRLELSGSGISVSLLNTGPVRSDFRKNATIKFKEHVDIEDSVFTERYKKELLVTSSKDDDMFTRDSSVVIQAIEHILESDKPRNHYYITEATKLLVFLKRILPTKLLDTILKKI